MTSTKRTKTLAAATVLCLSWVALGQTDYVLTDFPIAAVAIDSVITVKWAASRPVSTDSGDLYLSRVPMGSSIAGRFKVVVSDPTLRVLYNERTSGTPPQRRITFRPSNQAEIGPGVYYYIVAHVVKQAGVAVDTFCSNELQLIIESPNPTELLSPSDTITDLTPTFTWNPNPGVPYYHLILSDEKIGVDSSSGGFSIQGLSIVWQAITANTQIVYGAPDPSGTITASPPPMSPGQTYSVIVLNNYGNHPAYTSTKFGLPKLFTIKGDTLKAPRNCTPIGQSLSASSIRFKWTNLDVARANTYKVYIYVASKMDIVDAQMVVWENEVTAGSFAGSDTGFIDVNAGSVLTQNHYTWKVIAVDNKGAGRAGDTTSFDYTAPTGKIRLVTCEKIVSGATTINMNVAAVEVQVEVLDGSLEKPLLFYTDNNGRLSRDRPVGTYRLTAVKRGFDRLTKTVSVTTTEAPEDTLWLQRPEATVFGSILDRSGVGIDLARVTGVSERGDTVRAETDRYGSFVMSCYGADWVIRSAKSGYIPSSGREVTVVAGTSLAYGTDTLARVPFTLSGIVRNDDAQPIIGANVKLLRDGLVVGEVPSTSQTGAYAFSLQSGRYTLSGTKTGFQTAQQTLDISSSRNVNLVMSAGAALITGYVYGRTWVSGDTVRAPIPGAIIHFGRIHGRTVADTFSATADVTYGDYRISLPGNDTFAVWSEAIGFASDSRVDTIATRPGVTETYHDNLRGLAMIAGTVTLSGVGVGGVEISLTDLASGGLVASASSQANGYFEMRGIRDGTFRIGGGKQGLALSGVDPGDTVVVGNGRPDANLFALTMVAGNKTVKFSVVDGNGNPVSGSVKVQSPQRTTLAIGGSLTQASGGAYSIVVDATSDTLLDLSRCGFTVGDTATSYTASLALPVSHRAPDSVVFRDDSVSLQLRSTVPLDSVRLFYRTATASVYSSITRLSPGLIDSIRFVPPGDGRDMVYYFQAFAGALTYGYASETHRTYVAPNTKLTKLGIVPGADDTVRLAREYNATFSFFTYYSSAFIPKGDFDGRNVRWAFRDGNGRGCSLDQITGLTTSVLTGRDSTVATSPVELTASVPRALVRSGVDTMVSVFIQVVNGTFDSVRIRRVDPNTPNPVTTAPGDRAEFAAEGSNAAGRVFTITPQWSIAPTKAGTLSSGVFVPNSKFAGWVHVTASTGGMSGEYNHNASNPALSGIPVRRVITPRSVRDTVENYDGCRVIFPGNFLNSGETALLSIAKPVLNNPIERGVDSLKVIGSAYDIDELNGVQFRFQSGDSMQISLAAPAGYGRRVLNGGRNFVLGYWDDDSLAWSPLSGCVASVVGPDTMLTASVRHLSRYAMMSMPSKAVQVFTVWPNPFSPYVRPAVTATETQPQLGTHISFEPGTQVRDVQVRIYTTTGDLVWAVNQTGAKQGQRVDVWWNGKANDGDVSIDTWNRGYENAGDRMCRNGRYFVVLVLKDINGKKRQYMKPVILFK